MVPRRWPMRWAGMVACGALALLVATGAQADVQNGVQVPGTTGSGNTEAGPPAGTRTAEVVIDFDGVSAPCLFMDTNPLRNEYLGSGVSFAGPNATGGGAVLNACSNFGVTGYSGTNFLAFNAGAQCQNGGIPQTPETIQFTGAVSAVSLLVGSGLNSGVPITLDAYDAANVLVGTGTQTLSTALQTLSVTAPSIQRVVLHGANVFVVDNLRFTPGGIVGVVHRTWGRLKTAYR